MNILYNSEHYAIVAYPTRSAFELVDKLGRRTLFVQGSVAVGRVVGAVHAVAVALTGLQLGHVAVPHVAVDLGELDAGLGEVVVTEKRRQTGQTQELDTKDLKMTPSASGTAVRTLRTSSGPSRSRKNSRYSMMKKLTRKETYER